MLFVIYWELNESVPMEERLRIATALSSAGLYPPADVKILNWIVTADSWGITLAEADSASAIGRSLDLWRMSTPGFFKSTKTSPASNIDPTTIADWSAAAQQVRKAVAATRDPH